MSPCSVPNVQNAFVSWSTHDGERKKKGNSVRAVNWTLIVLDYAWYDRKNIWHEVYKTSPCLWVLWSLVVFSWSWTVPTFLSLAYIVLELSELQYTSSMLLSRLLCSLMVVPRKKNAGFRCFRTLCTLKIELVRGETNEQVARLASWLVWTGLDWFAAPRTLNTWFVVLMNANSPMKFHVACL